MRVERGRVIGHRDEPAARAAYPEHLTMSTSILAFHKLASDDRRAALVLERHGSLDAERVGEIVAGHGFGLALGERERLPLRDDVVWSS